jgi:DNA primase
VISEDTVDRVRREAPIADIIGDRVRLERKGRSLTGLCPFHKERTPSFNVNPERGFYHCFGCGASGDAIKFLRELDGLSFIDAVRQIAERVGIEVVETGSDDERRQAHEARRRREELFDAGDVAASFFQRMMTTHPLGHLAIEELARRGLDARQESGLVAETLTSFRVGYAPYGWDSLVSYLVQRGIGLRAAERVGLVVPRTTGSGHYDRFRHRLMFAVTDPDGHIVAFSGRALPEPSDEKLRHTGLERMGTGDPPAKYLNSPESPIYKKREALFGIHQARRHARQADATVLVEGNFDVVSLHARGIQNVVAPLGTAFTPEQGKQLRRLSANVVLLFDGDEAGKRAVQHARAACDEAGLSARVATLPEGTDPDDLVRSGGREAIQRLLTGSRSMLEYLIDVTLDRDFRTDDARARAAKIKEVAALIAGDGDPTVRAFAERYADTIAARLGIGDATTFRALAGVVNRALRTGGSASSTPSSSNGSPANSGPTQPSVAPPETARSRDRRRDIAMEVLGALLDFPGLLLDAEIIEALTHVRGQATIAIVAMRQISPEALEKNPELLLAKLTGPIHPFAAARVAAPRHERAEDARAELLRNVEKLKHLEHSRQRTEVVEELERMRTSGDFEREMRLLGEQARRARERHGL